ncbi:MAG: hypothetical protein M1813_008679 [Trichoglossum hirsutum]|nr:MAG: hypothetical protein M1813_008679 [Trichoglossum hirsutum]
MSSANEKDNLARIRDNQRRSRARRKEYLQSLETRWRECELQGVKASAELQSAARKVADENRRLRALLRSVGSLTDGEIDALLRQQPDGGVEGRVGELESMLGSRKPCGGGRGCGDDGGGGGQRVGKAAGCRQAVPLLPSTALPPSQPSTQPFYPSPAPTLYFHPAPLQTDTTTTNSTSSCLFGATLISDLGAKASKEDVAAAMGCPPGGGDCVVDNTVLLGAMDRFTEGI